MAMTSFAVTWDYRCPFARNAHEHLVAALEAGADWDVTFVPFSLNQMHVEEGEPDVWDDPSKADTLQAAEVAIVVRDRHPDAFLRFHAAMFQARHDQGRDIRAEAYMAKIFGDTQSFHAADRCMEIHGGMGLATDLPIEKFWRDQRSMMITEGPIEILKMTLARHVLRTYG